MSFEIYIDDYKLEMRKKKFKTIGLVIKEINECLNKDGKVMQKIVVNGQEFNENFIYDNRRCIIEVQTKSKDSIILEAVYDIKKNSDRFFSLIEEVIETEAYSMKRIYMISEIIGIVSWFFNVVSTLKSFTFIDNETINLEEYLEEFRMEYVSLKKAFEMEDEECILDILEYELTSLISEITDSSEEYLGCLLEEQKRFKLIN